MNLRVIFFGMLGPLSAIPLERLLDAGAGVRAAVVPSPAPGRAVSPIRELKRPVQPVADLVMQPQPGRRNVPGIAWERGIPVFEVDGLRGAQVHSTLAVFRPDLIAVSCFPYIVPRQLLALPARGCFNLHPSLLPALRGPAPLFWTFHEGHQPGVTVHAMNERADSGDIAAQAPVTFPDGISYGEAERLCAEAGAELLIEVCRAVEQGRLSLRPQREEAASHFPYPTAEDFVVTPDWPARRAFNFIRGVTGFGGPIVIRADNQAYVVREALGYAVGEAASTHMDGDHLWFGCADGMLIVRIE